jgi:hypothetical protein
MNIDVKRFKYLGLGAMRSAEKIKGGEGSR